ncbi:MAG TPA: deoxyribose-phosphate aldolase, partial [Nitrospirota bacterium]|nr:deoxyribose-phosphate aldolase [Nitrospirota bacterium]
MVTEASRLAQLIDHTIIRPDTTLSDLAAACEAAKKYGFSSVVVNGCLVTRARELLSNTLIKVTAVVGFPFGANTTTVKIVEAMESMKNGASELDIVINIGMARSGRWDAVEVDLKNIIAMTPQKIHKAIIETGMLTEDEIIRACEIAMRCGAEFIKTSTAYGPRGATVDDVRLIRKIVGSVCRVEASGGIRTLGAMSKLVDAGAERIGTSAGPAIME